MFHICNQFELSFKRTLITKYLKVCYIASDINHLTPIICVVNQSRFSEIPETFCCSQSFIMSQAWPAEPTHIFQWLGAHFDLRMLKFWIVSEQEKYAIWPNCCMFCKIGAFRYQWINKLFLAKCARCNLALDAERSCHY